MKAIILAAGKGTRMLPLTEKVPKVLIKIAGRPYLWYVLRNLWGAGIKEFGIVVGYKQEKIREFIEKEKIPNVTFIEQKEQLGTGHALMQARRFAGNEKFLVINGDNLFSKNDIKQILNKSKNAIAGFDVKNPSVYGVLIADKDKLIEIEEKPENPPSNLVNTGLYFFESEIFEKLESLNKSERNEYELTDAITALAKESKMLVYKLNDYWIDLGKLEDIPKVEARIRELFGSKH
ncbi:NTP transferase domain-containing protein [Candidatus Woesearchaeota archaeon]|nr:NTP transferase domain-containing protein [Candidatus Woesearchaeota archaeon]